MAYWHISVIVTLDAIVSYVNYIFFCPTNVVASSYGLKPNMILKHLSYFRLIVVSLLMSTIIR
jgi:hypothetical protein